MTILKIHLVDERARDLLENLVKLDLIRIEEPAKEDPGEALEALLARIHARSEPSLGLEEITEEVEAVRKKRWQGNE